MNPNEIPEDEPLISAGVQGAEWTAAFGEY